MSHRIAVVGGGPSGAVAAAALAREGYEITLFERTAATPNVDFKIGESLPPAAKPLLQSVGLWSDFVDDGHRPCHGNTVSWGSSRLGGSDYFRNPYGHGWRLDRARFERRLLQAAASNGVNVQRGVSVHDCRRIEDRFVLCLRHAQTCRELEFDAVVDASGRAGRIARLLGMARREEDSLLACYTRWSAMPYQHDERNLIEAVPQGWWYSAPLPSGERVVMHVFDGDSPTRQVLRSSEGFRALLALTWFVGELAFGAQRGLLSSPAFTAAGSSRLDSPGGAGWVAVGDAAAALDPLSSQGLMNAIESGQRGARALAQSLRQRDMGAIGSYIAWANAMYADYCKRRAYYYSQERRWPEAHFWRRRHLAISKDGFRSVNCSGVMVM